MFLVDGEWEEGIQWGSETELLPPALVPLDLNDPKLIFQLIAPPENGSEELDKAAAIVLPPLPKVGSVRKVLLVLERDQNRLSMLTEYSTFRLFQIRGWQEMLLGSVRLQKAQRFKQLCVCEALSMSDV